MTRANTQSSLDLLNCFMILFSAVAAWSFPLPVLLLAYAILGPAHYLTEILWLRDRKYFVEETQWRWLPILLAVLALFYAYGNFTGIVVAFWLSMLLVGIHQIFPRLRGLWLIVVLANLFALI